MRLLLLILAILVPGTQLFAEEGKSYIDGSISFLEIKDSHRQAEAWAMCSASYDLMAELLEESSPARSRQLSDLANGADLAVIISMVANKINDQMTPEKFDSVWTFSKLSGTELPKTRRTMLLAELESDTSEGSLNFIANLLKTVEVCAGNLKGQQTYIDLWREIAQSGLLKLE